MVWPEGTILKSQASRWSKMALEIDFSLKKEAVIYRRKNIINLIKLLGRC